MKLIILMSIMLLFTNSYAIKFKSKALGVSCSVSKDSCKRAVAVAPLCLAGPVGVLGACTILATEADKKNYIPCCSEIKKAEDWIDDNNIPSKILQAPLKFASKLLGIEDCAKYYSSNPNTNNSDAHYYYTKVFSWGLRPIDEYKLLNAPTQDDSWSCGLNQANRLLMYEGWPNQYDQLRESAHVCTLGLHSGTLGVKIGPPPQMLVQKLNSYSNHFVYLSDMSIEFLRELTETGRPTIVLISVGKGNLHYITVIKVTNDRVLYVDTDASIDNGIQVQEMSTANFISQWELKGLRDIIRKNIPVNGKSVIFSLL